ncbi:TPA: KpsF/GutQ family sugar-phosphate isomerase [Legionella pneumophila]|uniref:KpsF/GutQ family sugar-phosphate isomerase n=1 Tax=Legionella pneumophila TaxID=446 RepID=UPI0005C43191|nr:KpsF/GutQ family sugar-phosphate isomerase [Legionella pneumophila]HAT9433811.1 KpsF/GutQ family sugar-phosphate isomerase [Legionella pneumophila subsp. pneumophila]MCK1887563.1 KpsF/GutQ family sugar-phosphate isomerase [Legionella pneumophila]MCW8406547.1 KpsF/GutQ family sugar-phosphate isomerase [Legionella pneumophila]RYB35700.1 KpsF/GutQ family sugar-phosphate isomerase [Legionella pneumophila]RYB42973.1 KpsF/GutQ family sugar-phosphate isomerase [Legionella pneumophila]
MNKSIQLALDVIEAEAGAVYALCNKIGEDFVRCCELILACKGRVVVIGMGKSGHIGAKIAATLASTGTPAFFVHPAEASHGDLGMITKSDLVLAISNSGNTSEIVTLLPLIKYLNVPLITLTGNPDSTLAKQATINIDVSVAQEACPLGLAPTTSTTVALVMGDALAIALLDARGFTAEDFARAHPGGNLGKRLLLRVEDIWHAGDQLPIVHESTTISDALIEVTQKRLGMTTIINQSGLLQGIFTDGDIRRALNNGYDVHTTLISDVMTRNCRTIAKGTLVVEALQQMEKFSITSLIVISENKKPLGVVSLHDILKAGVV